MNSFVSAVDTVFDAVIHLSADTIERAITAYVDAGKQASPRLEVEPSEAAVEESSEAVEESDIPTFKTIQDILATPVQSTAEKNTIMYVCAPLAPLYRNPTVEFDGQIATVPYGEMVMMLEARGRFYRVRVKALEGWMLREDAVDRAAYVYPDFTIGEENPAHHPNTAHVRSILSDPFGLGRSEFPLQAGEYVLYRLWRKGIHLSWPGTRPRVPGLWYAILKGIPGVHVTIVPKAGSIMEYMVNGDTGHLAYVEAVFPDETITISEANYPDFGIYNERELTKAEWKELKPVFINAR